MKRPLLLLTGCISASVMVAQASNYPNGSTVDDFTVTDTQGQVHNLYTYTAQGKYVILDFFFTTCPPCQATQPYFSELHETYGCNGGDLVVLSINQGMDNDAEVIAYENTYGGTFAHAPAASMDGGGGAVTTAFGVGAFPTYCLIGPNNTMVQNDIWPVNNMQTYVSAFPAGSNIDPQECQSVIGVTEAAALEGARVFPMPSTGLVHIEAPGAAGLVDAEILDATGRTVRSLQHVSNTTLDLSDLVDGNYFMVLRTASGAHTMHRISLIR